MNPELFLQNVTICPICLGELHSEFEGKICRGKSHFFFRTEVIEQKLFCHMRVLDEAFHSFNEYDKAFIDTILNRPDLSGHALAEFIGKKIKTFTLLK